MLNKVLVPCILVLLSTFPVTTAHSAQIPRKNEEQLKMGYESHKSEFDFLLGDWEFSATNKTRGSFRGFWSAERLGDDAEILDEYRIVDEKGTTTFSLRTIRSYNAVLDQWELISMRDGMGLHDFGTGHMEGGGMNIEQTLGAMLSRPGTWRIRYDDIAPDRFSWRADRSLDNGKTWDEGYMKLEAHRIGPPRTLAPLIPKASASSVAK